jgi:hypothetical protein
MQLFAIDGKDYLLARGATFNPKIRAKKTAKPHMMDGMPKWAAGRMTLIISVGTIMVR